MTSHHQSIICKVISFIFLSFLSLSCAGIFGNNQEEGYRFYRKGLSEIEKGNKEAALKSFRKATLKHHSLATAYYELAKIYLSFDTIEDRHNAKQALKKAVQYEPKNTAYRLSLAELYLQQDLVSSAENEFKTILQIDSSNADAWYHLGRIHEKEYLYFKNMVSGDTSGSIIHFERFAEDEKEKSLHNFKRAIQNDPHLSKAYYRLGFLFYEEHKFEEMTTLFKTAIERNPGDKLAHLYLALAYQKLGRFAKAHLEYEIAWSLMDDQEKGFYQSIEPVLSSEEQKDYLKNKDQSQVNATHVYWKRRDPLFLTEYNERLMEHFSRVAFANLCFSNENKKIEGWKSDRGKVYIRYGAPLKKLKSGAKLKSRPPGNTSPRINPLVSSKETWYYNGFEFVFEDAFLNREYQFKWGMAANDDYKDRYQRMIKTVPQVYRSPYVDRTFEVAALTRQFMGKNCETILYFYSGIPQKINDEVPSSSQDPWLLPLQKGLFLFDSNWRQLSKSVSEKNFYVNTAHTFESNYFIDTDSLQVSSGDYQVAIEYLNKASRQLGQWVNSLYVRDFTVDNLEMSDLILADDIRLKTNISNINRSKVSISPNFTYSFKTGQDLYLYYEIYNLILDQNQLSDYTVSYKISKLKEKQKGLSKVFDLFKRDQPDKTIVETSYNYQGNRSRENNYRILQLKDYEPGNYELYVKVEDHNGAKKQSQHISFMIKSEQ